MSERATMNGKPVFTVPAKTVVNFDSRFDDDPADCEEEAS